MELLFELLSIACLGLFYAEVSGLNPFKFKPFNCVKCMSFWFAVLWCLVSFDFNADRMFLIPIAPILALYLEKLIRP